MKLDDYRDAEPLAAGDCHFCPAAASLRVTERETGETLDVCNPHRWTAFS